MSAFLPGARRPMASRITAMAPPAHPGMGIKKQRVPEDRAVAEQAEVVRPLHRRLAVAADHLPHFGDALRYVQGERNSALLRDIAAVAQEIGLASVDLHRRDDAGEPPAGMRLRLVDGSERSVEAGAAARLVPAVMQLVVVCQTPARRRIARCAKAA